MIATLCAEPVVGRDFLAYLERRLGVEQLSFAEEPTPIPDGWETYIYRFQLASRGPLPIAWRGPLILRIYPNEKGLPHLRHEFEAQSFMHRLSFPVAKPLLLEEALVLYDGPFLVMQCLPGRTLLDLMLSQPWRIVTGPKQLAVEQVSLHKLSAAGFPEPPVPFPDNQLEEIQDQIERFSLSNLEPGLEWLQRNRPPVGREPRIIHLDYHPLNVLWRRGRCSGVLDWCESALGDREADVAATLVLLTTAPLTLTHTHHRLLALPGRWLLWRLYLRSYRHCLDLDTDRLSYYMALAALRRLAKAGAWLHASPGVSGCKPTSIRHLNPRCFKRLESCFSTHTGLNLTVECWRRRMAWSGAARQI